MQGMTLKQFMKTIVNYDEIEFSYEDVQYDLQKENASDGKVMISIWQSGEPPRCCYSIEISEDMTAKAAKDIVQAKILHDGMSIASVENKICVEFFT